MPTGVTQRFVEGKRTELCKWWHAHATAALLSIATNLWTNALGTLLRGRKSSEKAEYGQRSEESHIERSACTVVFSKLN